mgnify:CR=1 FL=1
MFKPNKWKILLMFLLLVSVGAYYLLNALPSILSSETAAAATGWQQLINTILLLPVVLVASPVFVFYSQLEAIIGAAAGVLFISTLIIGLFLEFFYAYIWACLLVAGVKAIRSYVQSLSSPPSARPH